MASPRSFQFFFLIAMLLMTILNPSHSRLLDTEEDPKVNVSLYYETLCEGCVRYIVQELGDLYKDSELMSIINLHLVPYGNAILENGTMACEHGPDECYLNTIEACALDEWPSLETTFPFIKCVEVAVLQKGDNLTLTWNSYCDELGLDSDRIKNCYETGHGDELLLSYGKETDALIPPHLFVPWVTVNGNSLGFDMYNLKTYICDAYKGPRKLKACNNNMQHVSTSSTEEMQSTLAAVCHANV